MALFTVCKDIVQHLFIFALAIGRKILQACQCFLREYGLMSTTFVGDDQDFYSYNVVDLRGFGFAGVKVHLAYTTAVGAQSAPK